MFEDSKASSTSPSLWAFTGCVVQVKFWLWSLRELSVLGASPEVLGDVFERPEGKLIACASISLGHTTAMTSETTTVF